MRLQHQFVKLHLKETRMDPSAMSSRGSTNKEDEKRRKPLSALIRCYNFTDPLKDFLSDVFFFSTDDTNYIN